MTPRTAAKRHKHAFTALYWHSGWYGDPGEHVHSCVDESCDHALVGEGRECDGNPRTHRKVTLDSGSDAA